MSRYFSFCHIFCWKSLHFILCKFHSSLQIVWCTNRMTVDEYFVNLVKIIDGNLSQSVRSWLFKNSLRALINQFDVSGTTNRISKSNFWQFSADFWIALSILDFLFWQSTIQFYVCSDYSCFVFIKFVISSMRITLLSDLEVRIEAVMLQAVQQAILETKIAAGVQQALCSLNF